MQRNASRAAGQKKNLPKFRSAPIAILIAGRYCFYGSQSKPIPAWQRVSPERAAVSGRKYKEFFMSAVLTDTYLGDIPIERIEYLTTVRSDVTSIHTSRQSTTVSSNTLVEPSRLDHLHRLLSSTKLVKRDGVWCSVDRPVGCLALMVVVSE